MKTLRLESSNWPLLGPLTLTIGNFDGIHLGHKYLIDEVLEFKDTYRAALTFSPHPISYFKGENVDTLMTDQDKIDKFKQFNLDYLFIANFDQNLSSLSVDEFISNLKDLGVVNIVVGEDFKFANKGKGNVNDLIKEFKVVVKDDYKYKETRVSTTAIKNLLNEGNIKLANKLLNENYKVTGVVEHGNKVGKTIGFPTANISYGNYYLPKDGVYFVEVYLNDVKYYGISNIGNNPTINYSKTKKLEVHILDFDKDIYDQEITVRFIENLRDEKKFKSKEALVKQLNNDKMTARDIINNINVLK